MKDSKEFMRFAYSMDIIWTNL